MPNIFICIRNLLHLFFRVYRGFLPKPIYTHIYTYRYSFLLVQSCLFQDVIWSRDPHLNGDVDQQPSGMNWADAPPMGKQDLDLMAGGLPCWRGHRPGSSSPPHLIHIPLLRDLPGPVSETCDGALRAELPDEIARSSPWSAKNISSPAPHPPPSPGYFLLPSTRCRRWITQGERRLAPGSSPWLTSLSPANTWAGSAAAPCRLPVRRGTWPELGAGVPSNQSRASAWEGGGPPCELLLAAAIISCAPTGGWEDDVQKQPTPMA